MSRLEANRANALLSTGPRTEEGKAKVSLNAVKTALTGNSVVLPSDDAKLYHDHIAAYAKEFQPVGPEESALVQSLADIRWRLNRIPGLEMAIYARGRTEFAALYIGPPAEIRAMIDLETFLKYEKQLRNLHLQESRLARRRERELAELRALQQQRKAKETEDAKAASAQSKTATPANGFEFSTAPAPMSSPATPSVNDPHLPLKTAA
jgi:hypothetical protein